jgi:hypothetical protein
MTQRELEFTWPNLSLVDEAGTVVTINAVDVKGTDLLAFLGHLRNGDVLNYVVNV